MQSQTDTAAKSRQQLWALCKRSAHPETRGGLLDELLSGEQLSLLLNQARSTQDHKQIDYMFQLLSNLTATSKKVGKTQPLQKILASHVGTIKSIVTGKVGRIKFKLIFLHNWITNCYQRHLVEQLKQEILHLLGLDSLQEEQLFWQLMLLSRLFKQHPEALQFVWGSSYILQSVIKVLQTAFNEKAISTGVESFYPPGQADLNFKQALQYAFKLSPADLRFLLAKFNLNTNRIKEAIELRKPVDLWEEQEMILNLFGVLTCLGGYNQPLQDQFRPVFENVVFYARLNYSSLRTRLRNSKVALSGGQSFPLIDYPVERRGVMPLVFRLLSNLVHLNKGSGELVGKELVLMTLQCTGLAEDEATMREWALMLIRNLCEVSEKSRLYIGSLKVNIESL